MATANNILNKLTNQELSIQISLSGLSFCILKSDTNSITFLKHFRDYNIQTPFQILDNLQQHFNTIEALNGSFDKVTVIHVNEIATLVPKPLFNEESLADYLKFNSKILQTDFIAYDEIIINDSINVYVPYVNINNFIYEKFGAFSYKHYSTILIETILQKEKHAQDEKMYIHVAKTHFEIIVTDKGNLKLYNSYTYNTKEDFIYYILFTAEQLNLNPETMNIELLGNILEEDELYKILYTYVRHIKLTEQDINYTFIDTLANKHSNFTLIHSF